MKLHSLLIRQLKRVGIKKSEGVEPTAEQWNNLLSKISAAYSEDDKYRYTMGRAMDVSYQEMRALYKKLEYEKEKLETVMSDGLCVVDTSLIIKSINKEALRLINSNKEEVMGKLLTDFVKLYDMRTGKQSIVLNKLEWSVTKSSPLLKCEFGMLETNDGHSIPVSLSINPLVTKNKIEGALIIIHDMSERTEVEEKLHNAIVALEDAQEKHKHLAYFDSLTDLPNRRQFEMELEKTIISANLHEHLFALLYLDIDNFKAINDTFGHNLGDTLLRYVSYRLQPCLRKSDFIARLGGDEFAIIIKSIPTEKLAGDKAQQLIELFEKPFSLGNSMLEITVSIGIACYPRAGENANIILRNSDIAMYHAKRQGRNKFQYFTESLNAHYKRWYDIDLGLQTAIERDEFVITYQPIYNVLNNNISGVEALLRWDNEKLGHVSPDEFIPIAEETKSIIPIGEWVLRTALTQFKSWLDKGYQGFRITLNVSPEQLIYSNFTQVLVV